MATCTFFGHRECPDSIKIQLRAVLIDLLTNHDIDMFYVGNQGRFDAIVRGILRELKIEYQQINYAVVLAYMPGKQTEYDDFPDTMIPEGIESERWQCSIRAVRLLNFSGTTAQFRRSR